MLSIVRAPQDQLSSFVTDPFLGMGSRVLWKKSEIQSRGAMAPRDRGRFSREKSEIESPNHQVMGDGISDFSRGTKM